MKIFDLHADTLMDVANRMDLGETDVLARFHRPQYEQGQIGGLIYAFWMRRKSLKNISRSLRKTLRTSLSGCWAAPGRSFR